MTLQAHRKRIDALDADIVRLLNERTRAAVEIGRLKQESASPVYVPSREMQVFEKVAALNAGPLSDAHLRAIYREIMSAAISLEHESIIAFVGPASTASHQAALCKFGQSVCYTACGSLEDLLTAVETETAHYGVVPGDDEGVPALTRTLDLLVGSTLKIVAEMYLPRISGGEPHRFLVLGKKDGPASGRDKSTLALRRPSELPETVLAALRRAGLTPGNWRKGQDHLFLEIDGHPDDPVVRTALKQFAGNGVDLTLLGSYPVAFKE